jgi:transposase
MPEVLTMSIRVGQYWQLIGRIRHSNIKVVQAAEILGLSERHMYRLPLGYRSEGGQGLIHPPRGQATNRGSPKHVKKGVVPLYRQAYSCYGPISFAEMLQEHQGRRIDANTLRRRLKDAGLWAGLRTARRHRKTRVAAWSAH